MVVTLQLALYKSFEAAISALGERNKEVMIQLFEQQGITFGPESLDVRSVEELLSKLFGDGSDIVMDLAYQQLCKILGIEIDTTSCRPVEKIIKVLELKPNSN